MQQQKINITNYYENYPSEILLDDGYFLNDSLLFDYRLVVPELNEYIDNIYERLEITGRNEQAKKTALNNIISNLTRAYYTNKPLAISRNKNDYKIDSMYGMHHFTYTNIIPQIDALERDGFIYIKKGYHKPDTKEGRVSRIIANGKLITEIEEHIEQILPRKVIDEKPRLKAIDYSTPIIVRIRNEHNKKKKEIIGFRPTYKTERMKKFLIKYNNFISTQKICLPEYISKNEFKNFSSREFFLSMFNIELNNYIYSSNYRHASINETNKDTYTSNNTHTHTHITNPIRNEVIIYKDLQVKLHRVFSRDTSFKYGGRFYGSEYQQLSKEKRADILINNEPVIELDYSGFHLSMLYHKLKIDFEGELYLPENKPEEIRDIYKLISLVSINAEKPSNAIKGFNKEVFDDLKKPIEKRKFYYELMQKYNLDVKSLLKEFEERHSKINKYFYKDTGIRLQYYDSMITEQVMKHFTKKEIPILTIFDSFIVPEQHKEELRFIMNQEYKKVFGFDIKIK